MKKIAREYIGNVNIYKESTQDINEWQSMANFNKNLAICGLTLVELLIGLGVASVVLTFIGFTVQSVTRSSTQTMASASLQREAQIAQQILTGRINNAVYIYHDGELTLNSDKSVTTVNPITGNHIWKIDEHPIIATIQPPPEPNSRGKEGCYQFMAFYPVARSELQKLSTPSQRPPADPYNKDKWVLMQYQMALGDAAGGCWKPYWDSRSGALRAAVPRSYNQSQGRMLVDYVQPDTSAHPMTVEITTPTPNIDVTPPELATTLGKKDGLVKFSYQLEREGVGGSPATAVISTQIIPRNWSCPNKDRCDNAK